ncbi:hypothetical protein INR49_003149 [Caranx melampygus]|nr:hypothetical protein INR49_003149 [Caranx melampygus]
MVVAAVAAAAAGCIPPALLTFTICLSDLSNKESHGFKFGPIIGKLLCELSLGELPSYDLSPFRIRRFQAKTKSALYFCAVVMET